jgi:RNA polymerase sigma-70 factor (ECF subfamily)
MDPLAVQPWLAAGHRLALVPVAGAGPGLLGTGGLGSGARPSRCRGAGVPCTAAASRPRVSYPPYARRARSVMPLVFTDEVAEGRAVACPRQRAACLDGRNPAPRCWDTGDLPLDWLDARSLAGVLEAEFPLVLRAAALGDERAFARLWRDAHPPLLRYLRVLAGDAAEDVAGEVWLEVARKLARFRGGEPEFRGWLFTLARRRVIDMRRYAARHPVRLIADAGELDRPAADDTAAAALERMSTEAALMLIATLPSQQAEVIVLRVVAGLDVGQVARIVGKRPGAVRVAAHRGLRTLAARLSATAGQAQGVTR